MIAPSTPWGTSSASALMSASEEIPPLATTRASVRSQTRCSRPRFGPDSMPSEATSVTTYLRQPAAFSRSRVVYNSPPSRVHPRAASVRPRMSSPIAIRSPKVPMTSAHHSGRSGCGTDVDPSAAGRQRALEAGVVPDAAGEFDVEAGLSHDLRDELGVGAAAEGGIQIDQMQPFSTGALPALDGRPGITEPLLGARHALDQLYGLAPGDIHGRQQDQPCAGSREIHPMTLPELTLLRCQVASLWAAWRQSARTRCR